MVGLLAINLTAYTYLFYHKSTQTMTDKYYGSTLFLERT